MPGSDKSPRQVGSEHVGWRRELSWEMWGNTKRVASQDPAPVEIGASWTETTMERTVQEQRSYRQATAQLHASL